MSEVNEVERGVLSRSDPLSLGRQPQTGVSSTMAKVGVPYDLDSVRAEWIGERAPVTDGRYPVEYDPIRRRCRMVDDKKARNRASTRTNALR